MDFRIIKTPSPGTIDILMRRKGTPASERPENVDAVGLVQGKLIEMVVASDIAECHIQIVWNSFRSILS